MVNAPQGAMWQDNLSSAIGFGDKGIKKTGELDIRGTVVRVVKINGEDFVCLTDMAKLKSEDEMRKFLR